MLDFIAMQMSNVNWEKGEYVYVSVYLILFIVLHIWSSCQVKMHATSIKVFKAAA